MSERPVRWAWLLPAVVGAVVTVAVVAILHSVDDNESAGLPRMAVEPAVAGPTPSSPSGSDYPDRGGSGNIDFLHLRGDGLDMVPFGVSQRDIVATLTDVLGTPDEEADEPCDRRPEHPSHWVRWADLSVRIDDGTFVGYIEGVHFPPGHPAFDLGTPSGLSPGDSLDRARELYGELTLQPDPESQGGSEIFTVEDPAGTPRISGVVETAGEEQTVAAIFAGDVC